MINLPSCLRRRRDDDHDLWRPAERHLSTAGVCLQIDRRRDELISDTKRDARGRVHRECDDDETECSRTHVNAPAALVQAMRRVGFAYVS